MVPLLQDRAHVCVKKEERDTLTVTLMSDSAL